MRGVLWPTYVPEHCKRVVIKRKGEAPRLTPPTCNAFVILTAGGKAICCCKPRQGARYVETRGGKKHRAPWFPS